MINASCFGQQFAAGWIDMLVRIFVAFATIAIVFYVAAKTKKVKEDESAPSDTSDLSDKKPGP